MFPFSGIFADISCPLGLRGRCERPHCFYKHGAGSRDEFDASAGVQFIRLYASSGALVDVETQDNSFHELERINKEIETVRQEVEAERRRLSGCQIVQENSKAGQFSMKYVPGGTRVDRGPLDVYKTQAKVTKYVVDHSKPRTDLEYDPLSNFSADFWCHNSAEGQKVKNVADLTSAASTTADETAAWDFDDDDDDDDCVLIIDVPLSTEESDRAQSPARSLSGKCRDEVEQMKEVLVVPTLLDAPSQPQTKSETFALAPSTSTRITKNPCRDVGGDNNENPFCLSDDRDGENAGEARQMRTDEPLNLSATSVQQDHTLKSNGCELPNITAIKRALQPLTASLSLKTSATNSPHRRQNKKVQEQVKLDQDGVHSRTPERRAQLLVSDGKKMSNEVPRQTQGHDTLPCTSSKIHQEDAEAASCSGFQSRQVCSTSSNVPLADEVKSALTDQLLVKTVEEEEAFIIISSEDEGELNYSDLELSDSDPIEECYKIFMEANGGEIPNEDNKPAENVTPQPLAGKKRVAHEPTHAEPVAKSRPQPQVLVPFRGPAGFGSQPSLASNIQQRQQRAPVQTASVHHSQTSVSSTQKETQNPPPALTTTLKTAPPQNAYLNYIPVTGSVFDVDNNLSILVPVSALSLPAASGSSAASILTPIGRAPTSAFRGSQMCNTAFTIVQRGRPGAPVLIPAPAQKPSLTLGGASVPAGPSQTLPPPAKSATGKRKLKQAHEATKEKVPHDVRQRYINMFTEEFLKTTPTVEEAFQKALAEEKTVYSRSVNKVKYQSVAVNALKKLRHQRASVNDNKEVKSGRLKGNIPLNLMRLKSNDDVDLYKGLKDYIMTDYRQIENNFPLLNPEKSGCAVLFSGSKRVTVGPFKKICCRCGATYSVNQAGKHVRQEECTYHHGKGLTKRVPGGVETRYSCCEGVMGALGCQVFKLHVHDFLSLEGFVSTAPTCPSDTSCPGVFSLACEMCYTVNGLELSRVTVVGSNLQVVFDTFVKPTNEVIDYNTRFSGISEENVKGNCTSFKEVQETLLSFISADTILIGHGLEMALCLLKLLHGTVVDTSEVFPHRLGPPNKLPLNKLTADHLRKIIQESDCGHDTAEEAEACMALMLWKAKEDGKLKK